MFPVASLAPQAGLLGNGPEEFALIDQWMHLAETEVDDYTSFVRYMTAWPVHPYNKAVRLLSITRLEFSLM